MSIFNDILSVAGGEKSFQIGIDRASIINLSLAMAIAVFIATFLANYAAGFIS